MSTEVLANILDPIHDMLPPSVWDDPGSDQPKLKAQHKKWIERTVTQALEEAGYSHADEWLTLVLTGSLTTYQYSDESDCDVSLFVDAEVFPEWSRAEMIGVMVSKVDGTTLPGTTYPMQCFVVAPGITKDDLYKPGLRSGYDLATDTWINPPERDRVLDVKAERYGMYAYALEQADKMERLLKYEPDKAIEMWHHIHKKRQRDQRAGKGDFALSNVIYKFLNNRGLMPAIAQVSGEYIARRAVPHGNSDTRGHTSRLLVEGEQGRSSRYRSRTPLSPDHDGGTLEPKENDRSRIAHNDYPVQLSGSQPSPSSGLPEHRSSPADSSRSDDGGMSFGSGSDLDTPSDTVCSSSASRPCEQHSLQIGQEAYPSDNEHKSSYNLSNGSAEIFSASQISEASGEYIAKSSAWDDGWGWDSYPDNDYETGDKMGEPWEPGQPGKCFMDDAGRVHAWCTDAPMNNPAVGAPHHSVMADKLGAQSMRGSGWVHPDGRVEFPYLDEEPASEEDLEAIIDGIPGTRRHEARVRTSFDHRQVAKFVYDPVANRLVIGHMAAEEGEVESHYDLMRQAGIDPDHGPLFGQVGQNGYVETFGRPMITGFGKPAMNQYEADWRLRKALAQALPEAKFTGNTSDVVNPRWEEMWTEPSIEYLGERPTLDNAADQPAPEEGVWVF